MLLEQPGCPRFLKAVAGALLGNCFLDRHYTYERKDKKCKILLNPGD